MHTAESSTVVSSADIRLAHVMLAVPPTRAALAITAEYIGTSMPV